MRATVTLIAGFIIACCWLSAGLAQNKKQEKKAVEAQKKPAAAEKKSAESAKQAAPLRFLLPQSPGPHLGQVESVQKEGLIEIGPPAGDVPMPPPGFALELTEGYYIGVVTEKPTAGLEGARLFRALVTEVGENGAAKLQVGKSAAAAVKQGEIVALFRPTGGTTALMKKIPELAPLEQGAAPEGKDEGNKAQLAQSFNNVKQIMLALHNFHDAFNHFPPAVVIGPDKKPWHSWRVMLLPFLDAADIYNQYKWDEPWNGPNNKKLLSRMPPMFADPVYGENKEFFTHYVAITGEDAAFLTDPVEFDGEDFNIGLASGRSMREFTDGTSNTLMIGPVGPDRKIPWMKPEDIVVDGDFPELGKKGSFALPYMTEQGNAGVFSRTDGSATTILEGVDMDLFRALVTIHGGEIVDWSEVPSAAVAPQMPMAPVLYITLDEKKPVARLVMEPVQPALLPAPILEPPRATPAVPPPPRKVQEEE